MQDLPERSDTLKIYPVLFPLFLTLSLAGCSGSSPEIVDVFFQIVMMNDLESGSVDQRLSLLVLPDDPDGVEDLDSLFLIHDGQELFWTLRSEEWQSLKEEEGNWIGSSVFSMPDGSVLPSGEYRVLLRDLSGETAETQFYLNARQIDTQALNFPFPTVRQNRIFITSAFDRNTLLVYETGGAFIASFLSGASGIPLEDIRSKAGDASKEYTYFLYAFDSTLDVGLKSGPFFF